MEEKTIQELIHEGFEMIMQYIAEGATPKERATRALWATRTLLSGEPQGNEEWDMCEELKRGEQTNDQ